MNRARTHIKYTWLNNEKVKHSVHTWLIGTAASCRSFFFFFLHFSVSFSYIVFSLLFELLSLSRQKHAAWNLPLWCYILVAVASFFLLHFRILYLFSFHLFSDIECERWLNSFMFSSHVRLSLYSIWHRLFLLWMDVIWHINSVEIGRLFITAEKFSSTPKYGKRRQQ